MILSFLKFQTLFLSLIIFSSSTFALESPLFNLKTGYFFFTNSKMNKVYDQGGFDIQLCSSLPLKNLNNDWSLHAYGAVEYLQVSGRSLHGHQKTDLWSIPINLGVKSIYEINQSTQYYFTLGPRYFYLHQHNHSNHVYKNRSRNGVGFFINTGFNLALTEHFLIDIFGQYSYGKIHFHSGKSTIYTRDIEVSGLTFGGGIGYQF